MIKRLITILLFAWAINSLSFAQGKKYDLLRHKYFGEIKGKVVRIMADSVEFRKAPSGLLYIYAKKNIQYIITASGQWLSFNQNRDTFINNALGGWGYFNISGGVIHNLKPAYESAVHNTGLSARADLDYQVNDFYSIGMLIGYEEVKLKDEKFISENNLNPRTIVNGGTAYRLKLGLVNRFYLFPSSFISPLISIFAGYGNTIFSEADYSYQGNKTIIRESDKKGVLVSAGGGIKISTGEKSGFLLVGDYYRFFSGSERYDYLTIHLGYIFPVN